MAFDGKSWGQGIVGAVKGYVDPRVARLEAELAEVRRELADLRQRHDALLERAMTFGGTFNRGVTFERGAWVLHAGSSWVALRRTSGAVPNLSPDDWLLTSKSAEPPRPRPLLVGST